VTFGDGAKFAHTVFEDEANFTGAVFLREANFEGAVFGQKANFTGAVFDPGANFTRALFDWRPVFTHAVFGSLANFTGSHLGYGALFNDAIFKGSVDFTGKRGKEWASDLEEAVDFEIAVETRKKLEDRLQNSRNEPDHFLAISFAGANFYGEVKFSGRSFKETSRILPVRTSTPRQISMPRPILAGSISLVLKLDLFARAILLGLVNQKYPSGCVRFEKSPRRRKTTISNAISTSRSARPSAAFIWFSTSRIG
jgi:Pentapeptide repeats (9 copies)